jgi:hypothetical protein
MHICTQALLFGSLLLAVLSAPDVFEASQVSSAENSCPIYVVVLHTAVLFNPASSGDNTGELRVKWVLTSDTTALSNGSGSAGPSLPASCPEFHWDDALLSGRDCSPHTHCGGMFGTSFSLSADRLASGAHTLRLSPPHAPFCSDSVIVRILHSSPASATTFTAEDHLTPGGIPKIFHRIWLNPPSSSPRPIPSTYQRYWQSWKRLHQQQGWRFVTWTMANLQRSALASSHLVS